MAVRKREDEVFPNAAGIDVGASSQWVAVPRHVSDDSVREFGAMTDDLNAMADWLLKCVRKAGHGDHPEAAAGIERHLDRLAEFRELLLGGEELDLVAGQSHRGSETGNHR